MKKIEGSKVTFLWREIELVVTEEYKFEYRKETVFFVLFGKFGLSDLWSTTQNKMILSGHLFLQIGSFWFGIWCDKSSFCLRRNISLKMEMNQLYYQFLYLLKNQDSVARMETNSSSIESSSTTDWFWVEILMEEIKLLIREKCEFEYPDKSL